MVKTFNPKYKNPCLLVLIRYQGIWLGMLELHHPEAHLWTEDDVALVEAIA